MPDFGGGNGELCEELLARGYRAGIFEPSGGRGGVAGHRLDGRAGFLGFNQNADETLYDAVFCLEVFEHVPEPVMPAFLAQLSLVRPGGTLVDHPHRENLGNGVYCPAATATSPLAAPAQRRSRRGPLGARRIRLQLPLAWPCRLRAACRGSALARGGLRVPWWRRLPCWARDDVGRPPGAPKSLLAGVHAVDITLGSESNIIYVGERQSEADIG